MHRCDYAVTEAGFGADLGAEKFLDIKCRLAGLRPDAAVVVATVRALKMHGGLALNELGTEDLDALRRGVPNLLHHVRCIRDTFGLPCVVAINRFPTDTDREIALLTELCGELGVNVVLSTVWAAARRQIRELEALGFGGLPVCIAKTQASLSDDPALLGAPAGFTVTVRSVTVSAGAGFLVALTGDVLTMPGLPKVPAAENIDVDDDGRITGLF